MQSEAYVKSITFLFLKCKEWHMAWRPLDNFMKICKSKSLLAEAGQQK